VGAPMADVQSWLNAAGAITKALLGALDQI
jgi:hypothetical protein